MKILYSVQATGNGHISRAHQLYPYLCEYGDVDIMLSGSNATLSMDIPVKYRSKGMSLFYSKCGGLDFMKLWKEFNFAGIIKDARDLPVEKYDIVINDFDYITSRACRIKKVPSVQFGHQASFMSYKTPRPDKKSVVGEYVLKNFVTATKNVGLHFDAYDDFIFRPIIKEVFINAKPEDHGHITVYLPAYQRECLESIFKEVEPFRIHWFLPEIDKPTVIDNIHYFPVNQDLFNDSLIHCHGLLTGGGFETPAEALFLGKKLLTIPINGQYEQQCNAAALESMGVTRLEILDESTERVFQNWIYEKKRLPRVEANDIVATLNYVFNH